MARSENRRLLLTYIQSIRHTLMSNEKRPSPRWAFLLGGADDEEILSDRGRGRQALRRQRDHGLPPGPARQAARLQDRQPVALQRSAARGVGGEPGARRMSAGAKHSARSRIRFHQWAVGSL